MTESSGPRKWLFILALTAFLTVLQWYVISPWVTASLPRP